jgi:hypothetical protein
MLQAHANAQEPAQNAFHCLKLTRITNPDGERPTVTAVAATDCLRPFGSRSKLLSPHRSTPPDAFARDNDRQQVSWLAGCRFRPPSQKPVGPQWCYWSSAIRLQLRGQPRTCLSQQTHRIPLVSPFEHYQSQAWHRIGTASTIESTRRRATPEKNCDRGFLTTAAFHRSDRRDFGLRRQNRSRVGLRSYRL